MFRLIILSLLIVVGVRAESTQLNLTLSTPMSNTKFNGDVTIQAPSLDCQTSGGTTAKFIQWKKTYQVIDGVFSIALQANDKCQATTDSPLENWYKVEYLPKTSDFPKNTKFTEFWFVPSSVNPLTEVPRTSTTTPSPAQTVSLVQLRQDGANANDVLTYSPQTGWGPAPSSESNVSVASKTANYAVSPTEKHTVFTNAGAQAPVELTLPTTSAGLSFPLMCVKSQQQFQITVPSGSIIQVGPVATVSGGNVRSAIVGSCVQLTAIDSTTWLGVISGIWDVN